MSSVIIYDKWLFELIKINVSLFRNLFTNFFAFVASVLGTVCLGLSCHSLISLLAPIPIYASTMPTTPANGLLSIADTSKVGPKRLLLSHTISISLKLLAFSHDSELDKSHNTDRFSIQSIHSFATFVAHSIFVFFFVVLLRQIEILC